MTVLHATNGRFSMLGPPAQCGKCKKTRFDRIDWPNRDGTTEASYACVGCGRVYEPQPVDVMANLRKAFEDAGVAASLAAQAWAPLASIFADTARAVAALEEEIAVPAPCRDPYRRQNWKAMERQHARRYTGKKR
jgi:hypothetical protein